ncbi:MAG: zf-TFIIB domain-containing protein [Cyanobacteria bacterium P01_H01_bin.15]
MNLICPKCSGLLQSLTFEGVEVDRCRKCAGIWFDAQEADQLKNMQGSESLDIGDPALGEQYDHIAKPLRCPCCRQRLVKMLDMDKYSIWYESCPRCQGLWFDAGEFKKFKENFRQPSLQRLARRLFGR